MRKSISQGFCVLPFFGTEIPSKTACCLLKRDHDISDVRKEMLAGGRPDACSACWNLEDNGLESDRQLKNSALDYYWDRDIRAIEDDCQEGKYHVNHYKVFVSNSCNAACVTCGSGASTYWAKLLGEKECTEISTQELDDTIDYSTAVAINFVGGESMMGRNNFYILEKLLEAGNDTCFIQFTTNGSLKPTERQKNLMLKFKNLNIGISIDGIGPVFEYMRYPLSWDIVKANIDVFRQITANVCMTCTTSNVNLMYFPQLMHWAQTIGIKHNYNPVIKPSCFKPTALPIHVKNILMDRYGHIDGMPFFIGDKHNESDDTDFLEMKRIIKLQDKIKGINIKDYLPEFCELVGL